MATNTIATNNIMFRKNKFTMKAKSSDKKTKEKRKSKKGKNYRQLASRDKILPNNIHRLIEEEFMGLDWQDVAYDHWKDMCKQCRDYFWDNWKLTDCVCCGKQSVVLPILESWTTGKHIPMCRDCSVSECCPECGVWSGGDVCKPCRQG